jgi:hypothetical protein
MAEETPDSDISTQILRENGWDFKDGKVVPPPDIIKIQNQRTSPLSITKSYLQSDYGVPAIGVASGAMLAGGAYANYNRILADEVKNYKAGVKLAKQAVKSAKASNAGAPLLQRVIDAKGNPVDRYTPIVRKGGESAPPVGRGGKYAVGQSSRVGTITSPSIGVLKPDATKAIKAETWKRMFSGLTASGTTTSPLANPAVTMNVLKNGKVVPVTLSASDVLAGNFRGAEAPLEATRYSKVVKGSGKMAKFAGTKLAGALAHPVPQAIFAVMDAFSSYHNSGVAYDEEMAKSGSKTQAYLNASKEYIPLALQGGTFLATKNPYARVGASIPTITNSLANWLGDPNKPEFDLLNIPSMQKGRRGLMNWDGPLPEQYPANPTSEGM